MTAVGPGDLLECVEAYSCGPYVIERGRIYVCTEVVSRERFLDACDHGPDCKAGGVLIREAPTPPGYYWCQDCFKPVGRPASAIIAHHLVGAREDHRVAA